MNLAQQTLLKAALRDVPDFPKPGIIFKDISPILADPALFALVLDSLAQTVAGQAIDKIAGIEARGFIFAVPLAVRLGVGFIPIRKVGKLPWRTHREHYALEYGTATMEMHEDAVAPGERVWLVDDLLATGGTCGAAIKLIQSARGEVVAASFLMELTFLHARENLQRLAPIHALLQ